MPAPTELETIFGRYTLKYTGENGQLAARRTLVIAQQSIAPQKYVEFKAFTDRVRQADGAPVVLSRR